MTAKDDVPLIGVSYTTYRRVLKKVESLLGIAAGYTPHSPRAGFASESFRDGMDVVAIKEQGRWLVDSSFRCYIDVVQVAMIQNEVEQRGLAPIVSYAESRLAEFFPEAAAAGGGSIPDQSLTVLLCCRRSTDLLCCRRSPSSPTCAVAAWEFDRE